MGIIALFIALALNLASGPNQVVPQVLGAYSQAVAVENQKILEEEKNAEASRAAQIASKEISHSPPVPAKPDTLPWGSVKKIGDHLYRTRVASDGQIATSDEILSALNKYRADHGSQILRKDDKLCDLANKRAQEQDKQGTLDSHRGFNDYMADQNHWQELNVHGIGENSAWNYQLSGVHLIEWVFNADDEHRNNQLNPEWTLGCAGVSGKTVDVIFGRR